MTTDTPKTINLDDIAGLIDVDRKLTAEIDRLEELHKAKLAELRQARDDTREQIQRRMGDAEEAHVGGVPVVRWKWSKPGSHLDQKALKRDNPDLIKRYTVPSNPARKYVLLNPEEAGRG